MCEKTKEKNATWADVFMYAYRQRGWSQGYQFGRAEGEWMVRYSLLGLLARRYGAVTAQVLERVEHAKIDQLETWMIRTLGADSIDEVFAEP